MSTDLRTREREFLDGLAADTGRDLAGWMRAIDALGALDKNDVIDWLRQQGFSFARASWLERVHYNGGRAIYGDGATPATVVVGEPPTREQKVARSEATPTPRALRPEPTPVAPVVVGKSPATHQAVDELLASAKAYRPLANFLLAEIRKAMPSLELHAEAGCIALAAPQPFGILVPGPKQLKLGLALGDVPFAPPLERWKHNVSAFRSSAEITHMAVLDDARQITPVLVARITEAAQRAA